MVKLVNEKKYEIKSKPIMLHGSLKLGKDGGNLKFSADYCKHTIFGPQFHLLKPLLPSNPN